MFILPARDIPFLPKQKNMLACFSLAAFSKTGFVSRHGSPTITGTSSLMIPAFSKAIFSGVSPRIFIWSQPMLVITDSSRVIIFVLSSRPPRPVSMIAMSTFLRGEVAICHCNCYFKRKVECFRSLGLLHYNKINNKMLFTGVPFILFFP